MTDHCEGYHLTAAPKLPLSRRTLDQHNRRERNSHRLGRAGQSFGYRRLESVYELTRAWIADSAVQAGRQGREKGGAGESCPPRPEGFGV